MKKICLLFLLLALVGTICYATEMQDVQCFFNRYVEAANNYDNNYFNFYSNDAKIIRVVEKPDGTFEAVNIPLERYKSEAKKSQVLMKMRKYKNFYSNIKILPHGKDYKIAALRMPSTSDYKVPSYFIVGKDCEGNWKIKEESMNTKVQAFLGK
ncbi:hypothetical protein IJ182_01040 [bacterium]|nr:hypothetical protein [bacterium]